HTVSDECGNYNCGWTQFDGITFQSKVQTTIVNGLVKYHKGKIVSDQRGQCLEFNHEV
ncbi:dihydroorotase, partial [Francisella tularensis subsp. holarctica]|nr:dihydroorotase [Francisella tularensis subsp. holarctica]